MSKNVAAPIVLYYRIALEVPGVYNQQAIACVTLLGELYNYSVCDSAIIYKVPLLLSLVNLILAPIPAHLLPRV